MPATDGNVAPPFEAMVNTLLEPLATVCGTVGEIDPVLSIRGVMVKIGPVGAVTAKLRVACGAAEYGTVMELRAA